MSTTDELLEEMLEDAEEYATPVADDDLQFWIDEHLRVISIPKNGVVAGVEGDKNVNKIKFGMNRYYHGFDMSTFSGRILYSNAKGNKNYYNIADMQTSGNIITFSWLVDADAVQYMGKTAFVVYLFKTQGSELRQKFYSTLATLKVLEGMEVDSAVPVEKQTDIIERMKEEISAYAEEVKKSLPADYTAMTEQVNSLKEDLGNQENKLEPIVKSNQDLKDVFYICDADGNIICKVDKDGVHSVGFDGKNLALNDVISSYEDSFYISDSAGNIIFKADKDGVQGLNMGTSSGVNSPFKGMKLLTIGDSLSAHNNWQKWLVEWLGVTFDNDENINGKDGHKPMAKGGTAIAPTTEDSIYMRSLDAKYYADDINGTAIIIYAGQNDSVTLGTIDDTPYTEKIVTTASKLTFYSSYMGMIENILADIPSARIYLMTQMPVRLEIGMEGTAEPYVGIVRFPDMESVLKYEAIRYKKVEAIRAISKKYSLPCIDLWEDSGINDYNSKYWYGDVGGTCGQVHPNKIGYKRMAEVAVAKMY